MQDTRTGHMHRISKEEFDKLNDRITPDEKKKIPVFKKGEVVKVKCGRFSIIRLTPLGMILKGVPDTTPLG